MRTDKDTIYFPSTLREGKNFNANYVSIRNSGEGVILSKTEYKFRHTEQSEVSQRARIVCSFSLGRRVG